MPEETRAAGNDNYNTVDNPKMSVENAGRKHIQ